jgi:uncharacterized membrane protein
MIKSTAFDSKLRDCIILLACALFGLTASFVLTLEKIHLLQNPTAEPSCSINPFITCASAISSAQSEFLGVPLTLFGIMAYSALLALTVFLITKSVLSINMWRLALGVAAAGVLGVQYLIGQSVFVLHVICPWCFGVWLTVPIIFTVMLGLSPSQVQHGRLQSLITHRWAILLAWYSALATLLLVVFWDAWMTLL